MIDDAKSLLQKAQAAKIIAETAQIKSQTGELVTKEQLQSKLEQNEAEILKEIYHALKNLPKTLTQNGIIEKKKEKKVAAIIKELLRNET